VLRAFANLLPLACCLSLVACGNYRLKAGAALSAQSLTRPTYTSIRETIILPKCAHCHTGGEEGDFTRHAGLAGASEDLFESVSTGGMPPDAPMLTDDEILALRDWVAKGAPND